METLLGTKTFGVSSRLGDHDQARDLQALIRPVRVGAYISVVEDGQKLEGLGLQGNQTTTGGVAQAVYLWKRCGGKLHVNDVQPQIAYRLARFPFPSRLRSIVSPRLPSTAQTLVVLHSSPML